MRLFAPILVGFAIYLSALFTLQKFSPFLILPEQAFLINENDDHGHVAFKLRRLKSLSERQKLAIVLGPSSFREALPEDDSNFGGRYSLMNLSTSDQTLFESWKLIGAIPDSNEAIILIGVNPLRFRKDIKDIVADTESKGFSFPQYDSFSVDGVEVESSLYRSFELSQFFLLLKRNSQYKLSKFLKTATFPSFEYKFHQYDHLNQWNESEKSRMTNYLSPIAAEVKKNLRSNLKFLGAIHSQVKSRGWNLALVEGPMTKSGRRLLNEGYKLYDLAISQWSKSHHVPYLRPQLQVNLTRADFYDYMHLRPSGRKKFAKSLSNEIKKLEVSRKHYAVER